MVYYLANRQWSVLQKALGYSGSYVEYMQHRFGDPESYESRIALQALKTFIDLCKNRGTPLAIVLFPRLVRDFEKASYTYGYLHNRVLEICTQEGITCIDIRSTLAPYSFEIKKLRVSRFDSHPGPFVNRLVAERLMETFGQTWLSGVVNKRVGSGLGHSF